MSKFFRHWIALLLIVLPAVMAAAEPTAQEQVLLERINRARLQQEAESRRLNLDFQEGLRNSVAANLQPLVWGSGLQSAAADQNRDMYERNYFAHISPEGLLPIDRVRNYSEDFLGVGQNLGAGRMYATPDALYIGWMVDAGIANRGHRAVILDRWIDSFGASRADHTFGYYGTYWTANFGIRQQPQRHVTGVVFRDLNRTGLYDEGEGLAGWKLRAIPQSPAPVTEAGSGAAFATAADVDAGGDESAPAWTAAYATGGYAIPVPTEGDYTIEALAPNGDLYVQTVGVEAGNVKVDFELLGGVAPVATGAPVTVAAAVPAAGGKKSGCALSSTPSSGWLLLCGMGCLLALTLALRIER